MPGTNSIPVVSQVKAGLQLITGDTMGARETCDDFIRECPIVSQITSAVQLARGDRRGALRTLRRCLKTLNGIINGIPILGHIKGLLHHLFGDHRGGNRALNSATRSSVILGSGLVAGMFTGGLAAIPTGIAAGAAYDSTHSLITRTPQGLLASIYNAIKNPSAGAIFDVIMLLVGDGLGGYAGAKIGNFIRNKMSASSSGGVSGGGSGGGSGGSSGGGMENVRGNISVRGETTGASVSAAATSETSMSFFEWLTSPVDGSRWKGFLMKLFEAMDEVGDDMILMAFEKHLC